MRYLVTGGAGFIGSHITDALVAAGYSVRVIDNLLTGKKENLNPKAEFFEADLRDLKIVAPLFQEIDGVFHVAAYPRVQTSIENPIETHEHNVNATLNVLVASRDAKVQRLVYSASSSAYGDQPFLPLREDMLPLPMSPYGVQKYVGEHYCRNFSLLYGLETISLRYFNVYGPRMADEGAYLTVIQVFLQQKAKGLPLTITGDGTQTRDFTHVRDVVKANMAAMGGESADKGEVINIGGGQNKSVNEIAAMIGGKTTHLPPRLEPHDTLADISRAKELLGWEPLVSFEQGIQELKQLRGLS